MAELDPVTQQFIADMTQYLDEVQRGADDALRFAAANDEAASSLTKVRDDAATAAVAVKAYDDAQKNAGSNTDSLRTKLSSLGDDMKTRGTAAGAFAASITGAGDAMTAASGDASMFSRVMAGAGLATGLLEPVMAGAIVAVGGLASGLTAAGAGLGAFGIVAKANLSAAGTAAQQVQQAQDTYNASIAAGIPQAKAYQAEQKAIGVAYAELTPAQITLSKQIGSLSNQWQSFTAGFAPVISGILGKIQPIVGSLLADFGKLATAGGDAIQALLPSLNMALVSPGFKNFIDMLANNAGPAIVKLGVAIGHIVVGIGGILKAFMPMSQGLLSGIDQLTAKFAAWGSTLSGHTGFQSLMETFKSETPQAIAILKNLAEVVKNVAGGMAGLATGSNSKTLLQVLEPLSGILAQLSKNQDLVRIALYFVAAADAGKKLHSTVQGISGAFTVLKTGAGFAKDFASGLKNSEAAASDATGVWGTFGGKISTIGSALASAGAAAGRFAVNLAVTVAKTTVDFAVTAAKAVASAAVTVASFLAEAAAATLAFIAENLATLGIIAGIALLVAAIVFLATHWQQVWTDVKNWAVDAWHFLDGDVIHPIVSGISSMVSSVTGFFQNLASTVISTVTKWATDVISYFKNLWDQAVAQTRTGISDVVNFFTSLPGKVMAALAALPGELLTVGKNILIGLWNGLISMGNQVISWIENFASNIIGAFGSVLKILSPSQVFYQHGVNTMQGYIDGVKSMRGAVQSTMAGAGSAIASGGVGAGAATGGSAAPMHFHIPISLNGGLADTSDPRFMQGLQRCVQESILRYCQVNPSNGLVLSGKLT